MKPWPMALRTAYPLPEDVHPMRPWWTWENLNPQKADDGVYRVPSYGWARGDGESVVVGLEKRCLDPESSYLADIDARKPLPRPPLRVMQVWADEQGNAVVLLNVDKYGIALVANYLALGLGMSTSGITGFLQSDFPFLVADPLCPDAAPWAPPEGS